VLHIFFSNYTDGKENNLVPEAMLSTCPLSEQNNGLIVGEKIIAYARTNMSGEKETVPDDLLYPRAWHCLIPAI